MSSIDVETLRRAASLAGFELTAADLAPLLPAVEGALGALERLESLPVAGVEPVTQYRVV
jgi:Asp-tRNA(Asn)/Glu-tRNA(Gln) amidotransferase C subunit